ncbi:hypothetical protein JTE90_019563 [Oedothorax gibbosus]|uniref:Uncharacterized protein n=1 Tax=Oedothorax gibbosus TaxID=931172 RepID=A0AAV6V6C9_9ARAC|nr:hypothetical protein JTE90_019563 [Oedothorax gibbosus]
MFAILFVSFENICPTLGTCDIAVIGRISLAPRTQDGISGFGTQKFVPLISPQSQRSGLEIGFLQQVKSQLCACNSRSVLKLTKGRKGYRHLTLKKAEILYFSIRH